MEVNIDKFLAIDEEIVGQFVNVDTEVKASGRNQRIIAEIWD